MTTEAADFLVIDEIARNALRGGDTLCLTMGSESMAFALPHGCKVTVRWLPPERLRRGHIVAIRRNDTYWQIHRLARTPKDGALVTRSDLFGRDPGAAAIDQYLGVVTLVDHPIGPIDLETLRGRLTERLLRVATGLVLKKRAVAKRMYARLRLKPDDTLSKLAWRSGIFYGTLLLKLTGAVTPEIAAIYIRRTYADEPLESGASDLDTTFILRTPTGERSEVLRKIAVRFRILRNLCPLLQHTEIFFLDEFESYARSTLFHALTLPRWRRSYGVDLRPGEKPLRPAADAIIVEEAAILRRVEDIAYEGIHGGGNPLTRNYHLWKILTDSVRVMLLRDAGDRLTDDDRLMLFTRRKDVWTVGRRVAPDRLAPLLEWETVIPPDVSPPADRLFFIVDGAVRLAVEGGRPSFESLAELHAWAYAQRARYTERFSKFTDESIRGALAALSRNSAATEPIIYAG